MIFKYTFEDGTLLRLLDVSLSCAEVRKLEELHGKCIVVEVKELHGNAM